MAQNHKRQDTPSASATKAIAVVDSAGPPPPSAASVPSYLALAALGTNAWLIGVGWVLISSDVSLLQASAASAALLPVWIGAAVRARAHTLSRFTVARWLLIGVFPVSLAAALCLGSEETREQAHSPLSMLLAAASVLAYGAAAFQACRTPLTLLPTRSHRRRSEHSSSPPPRSIWVLRLAALLLWLGAVSIALVAPLSSDYAQLEQAWGEAADAGAAFTAVVGGAIAVSMLGIELGPLLKLRRTAHVSTRTRRNRVATMLFLTLCGGLVYLGLLR